MQSPEKRYKKNRLETFFINRVSEIIRVIPEIEGIRLITFWAKTILISELSTAFMNTPKLSTAVGAEPGFCFWMWSLTQDIPDLRLTIGTIALLDKGLHNSVSDLQGIKG